MAYTKRDFSRKALMGSQARESKIAHVRMDYSRRVFSEQPPIVAIPPLANDLTGFETVNQLLCRASKSSKSLFPFDKELALYLLLVASLWPHNGERLLTAARIFSGALNSTTARAKREKEPVFSERNSSHRLKRFNSVFFERVGGWESLLFAQDVESFHKSIWQKINELAVLHDAIEFIYKTALVAPRFSSLKSAFHAVAHNVFDRENGYGVVVGAKRAKKNSEQVTTSESIRAKWNKRPETLLLSYVLTRFVGLHFRYPVTTAYFQNLSFLVDRDIGRRIERLEVVVKQGLSQSVAHKKSAVNELVGKDFVQGKRMRFKPLSSSELERAIHTSDLRLTEDEKKIFRDNVQRWWR